MTSCERCGEPIRSNRIRKDQRFCGRDCARRSLQHSADTKAKMRESALRRISEKPHTLPPKNSGLQPFLGRTHTPDARAKISASKSGDRNPQFGKVGALHPNWTGDAVGYGGLHDWLTYHYGQPVGCDFCQTTDPNKRYEWANISGEYRRNRLDFHRLCKACHNDYDGVNICQQKLA